MTFTKWLRTPKAYMLLAMLFCLAAASAGSHTLTGVIHTLAAVLAAVLTDNVCRAVTRRKWSVSDSTLITGFIVGLILSITSSALTAAVTAVLSILSKHLLVYKKKAVFNPAAVGLLLVIPLLHTGQSWWGAFGDLPVWMLTFLLICGYPIVNRIHKYPQVFTFLAATFGLLSLASLLGLGEVSDAFRPPFINATLFFAFFMLTDPPTSPAKTTQQMLFGLLVAMVGTLVYVYWGGLSYLYIGLLAGNLYSYLNKRSAARASVRRSQTKKARSPAG
ncbi:RnfABCDGE type electron transport complex subunit D [Paenibacillus sp. JX-17]|uniref:RnfABCDGE type electron transport complex subunit D n=1 Tax=Paenibacillus lacisoli TaxID=3064525 RepID=A0ABT9CAI6_9BACL|nr:RnfABCDGE type electron transport complex subunit D [Paenibacillus sp. JX-17]MDO7906275.1 RnfABCDGE type electron transport complex subunit D [Paenibacillus sp. JX-17]